MLSNTHFAMAVHVLSALAYNDQERLGSADLARTVGTNPSFLRGLIGQLRDAGLVETRLGKGGGTRLAKPAASITLFDIYRATEAGPAMHAHVCSSKSRCIVARNMRRVLADINGRLEAAVAAELRSVTLQDVVMEHIPSSHQ